MANFFVLLSRVYLLFAFVSPAAFSVPSENPDELTVPKPLLPGNTNTPSTSSITSISPRSIKLEPGGKPATVNIDGKNLERLESVRVMRDGRFVPEIIAKLVQPWPTSKRIELQAGVSAPSATGYWLRGIVKVGTQVSNIDVPSAIFSLEVVSLSDLVVTSIAVQPPFGGPSTSFTITVVVKNIGIGDMTAKVDISVISSAGAYRPPKQFLNSLAVGESKTVGFPAFQDPSPGTQTVTVTIDSDRMLQESNENNNTATTTFFIEGHPVACGSATPMSVVEGCACNNCGRVTFDHSKSASGSPTNILLDYQWIFELPVPNNTQLFDVYNWASIPNNGFSPDGKAWHSNAIAATPVYSYNHRGTYNAALRIIDSSVPAKSNTTVITGISVTAEQNVPPVGNAGGPYTIFAGDNLTLQGTMDDANKRCQETLKASWYLNNDQILDFDRVSGVVTWATLAGMQPALPRDQAFDIILMISDAGGNATEAKTQLSIVTRTSR